jgi:acetoin utilization deacetylase AcuC-like enzyme
MTGDGAPVLLVDIGEIDEHDSGAHHPERPERLRAVEAGIEQAGLSDAVRRIASTEATVEQLTLVHTESYIRALEQFVKGGGRSLDPDTIVGPGSWTTALHAAGGGLAAIGALRRGEGDAAFVAVRPPGHHATSTRAMGFCLVNNVAVGAAGLAAAGERVAIIDFDVHHGNGTEQIFWDDPRVLYVSTHQWPAYPGTGEASAVGGDQAVGTNVNVPLPPGATGEALRAAFDDIVEPAIEQFAPTWILISAGFDAHRDDPLADLRWTAGDYADITDRIVGLAPQRGRVVAYLEGGYDLDALASCSAATIASLAGERWRPEPSSNGGPGRDAVERAALARRQAIEDAHDV